MPRNRKTDQVWKNKADRDEWILWQLRRVVLKSKARSRALVRARVSAGHYLCNHCLRVYKKDQGQMDHIVPVDLPGGPNDLYSRIDRLVCDTNGWQWLCHSCHASKTYEENFSRRSIKVELSECP